MEFLLIAVIVFGFIYTGWNINDLINKKDEKIFECQKEIVALCVEIEMMKAGLLK